MKYMTKKQFLAYILIPLALGVIAAFIFLAVPGFRQTPGGEMKSFRSEQYNLAFQYPANYKLEERVINTAQRYHVEYALIDSAWVAPRDGEGPTAITFGVYQNNLDKLTAEQWIKGNNFSNYKLSDGNLIPVQMDDGRGFMYHWDGLYPAEQIVVAKGGNIYYLVMTYLDFSDNIIKDFQRIPPTVDLD